MKRQALLLGFYSVIAQVLLLRELMSSFHGDELFIGTALFGWLVTVAAGAAFSGKRSRDNSTDLLFLLGAICLPLTLITAKLIPIYLSDTLGEMVPFTQAALFSIIIMAPSGVIAGWLFPAITRMTKAGTDRAVTKVYLYEGLGAFVGGIIIAVIVGRWLSTLTLAIAVGLAVIANILFFRIKNIRRWHSPVVVIIFLLLLIFLKNSTAEIEKYFDSIKYPGYEVQTSLDTPYSHQTVLERDDQLVLMTDNQVEAVQPDLMIAENLLLPPLLYIPNSKEILYFGRADFALADLIDSLPNIHLTQVDPRAQLDEVISRFINTSDNLISVDQDAVSFANETDNRYDIIIIPVTSPDNFQTSRLVSPEFLMKLKHILKDDGILFIPTGYDSDRYLSAEKQRVLGTILNAIKLYGVAWKVPLNFHVWPGEMTLFIAQYSQGDSLSTEHIIARTDSLPYKPQYINSYYLFDRLSEFKTERLKSDLNQIENKSTLYRPRLVYYQALLNSFKTGKQDKVLSYFMNNEQFLWIIPLLIVLFFLFTLISKRKRTFGLFLYFLAGLVSLSMELLCFYVFQTKAGSLYSEMAVLIGAFMLGLAAGTYICDTHEKIRRSTKSLLLMFLFIIIFIVITPVVPSGLALITFSIYIFILAMLTGWLFVSATRIYYGQEDAEGKENRGTGYAWELAGSSLGALSVTTLFLPIIGLIPVLIVLSILVLAALAVVFIRRF